MRKVETGGSEKDNEHLQTIAQVIMNDPRLGNLCQSGWLCINLTVANEESLVAKRLKLLLKRSDDVIATMTLELTHVLKSFCVHINSVTLRKLSLETRRLRTVYKGKCDLQLSSELSSLLSPIFLISEKSGKTILKPSDYSEYPSLVFSTAPSSTTSTTYLYKPV